MQGHFAFEKGHGSSNHNVPFDALALLLDGEADITVSGKNIRTNTGEAVIMPANKPHTLTGVERLKMFLTIIKDA